jgi:LmbE family N-acetylglucosaminyl deacetylase
MAKTLLAVHAHPDDETITMGGTLARYSAAGVRTVVVTCTRGDLGEVRDPSLLIGAESVADLRDRELDAATARLGVSRVVRLGYSDSGMAGWPENYRPGAFHAADLGEAAARLVEVIDQERPQVMLAYDATGGYGHPDHVKAHQVAVAAFEASGVARPARLYFVRFPLSWSREFVRALREAGIDAPGSAAAGADAGPDVTEIGTDDSLVTTRIDVRSYVAIKRAALACHKTQMSGDHFLMRMPDALAQRLWAYEFFSRADTSPPADEDAAERPSLSRVADDTVTGGSSLHRTRDDAITEVPAQHPAAGDAAFGERSLRRAAESGVARHADIGESNNGFEGLESDLFAGLG